MDMFSTSNFSKTDALLLTHPVVVYYRKLSALYLDNKLSGNETRLLNRRIICTHFFYIIQCEIAQTQKMFFFILSLNGRHCYSLWWR